MIRVAAVLFAVVAFVVPLLTARVPAVAVSGLTGLLLAAVGIATLWRWPVTAAACVFLIEYAGTLWLAGRPVGVLSATGFGLSLLFLLQSVELARCARRSTLEAAVVRSHIVAWTGFGVGTLAAAMLLMALAGGLVASIPFAAAPFAAAAGALGVVLTLAATVRGAWRRRGTNPRPTEVP